MLTQSTGASLAVRHLDTEMHFDWSLVNATSKKDTAIAEYRPPILWAAFYNDCEHEVYEVASGHRVTLTYNLYIYRGQGYLAGAAPKLNPTQLPLYTDLKYALATPGFLKRGSYDRAYITRTPQY
jgi:hypothetical protein